MTSNKARASADDHTAALWLFDEPEYFHETLTDAGPHRFDLRLLHEGHLLAGRFGGALRFSSNSGPAVTYPCQSRIYDDMGFFSTDSWKIKAPVDLLAALAGKAWTVEFWFKPEALGADGIIIELGTAGNVDFQCGWRAADQCFTLVGARLAGSMAFPADAAALANGQWHHVAFVRNSADQPCALYLDGRLRGTAKTSAGTPGRAPQALKPSLIGSVFEGPSDSPAQLGKPVNLKAAGTVDFFWGEPRDLAWAEVWRGVIEAPVSGDVEFWVEAVDGAQLSIGDKPVIEGWTTSRVRSGTCSMRAGEARPFRFEFRQLGQTRRCRLLWRLPGKQWELVPPTALKHRLADEADGLAQMKGAMDGRFYLALGSGWLYDRPLQGMLDELRVSDIARYTGDFPVPGSLSRNYAGPPAPRTVPNGPPLLFEPGARTGPLALGSRKHLFLDEAIIEARHQMRLTANPPKSAEATDLVAEGDCSVYDDGEEIRFMYGNGLMWRGDEENAASMMATSKDGLHFELPKFTHASLKPNQPDNVVLRCPVQGRFFKDPNPAVTPEERYKFGGFIMHRGVFLFTSPDGIHWRRNETILAPFDIGGGVEMFWDDQRGTYVCFIRSEGWTDFREPFGRAVARAETTDPYKPWPFQPSTLPAVLTKAWSLPSISTELPVPFCPKDIWNSKGHFFRDGQVYRSRAIKYPWAADAYVAFPWRLYGIPDHEQRQTDMGVSRDGVHWTFFEAPYYAYGMEYEGGQVLEALSADGVIRRGDELWQYAHIRFRGHRSGQIQSGGQDRVLRYKQRLDGFVSLDAGKEHGWMVSRPFVFTGKRLELNIAAAESARVALLDEHGNARPGFSLGECDPITGDAVHCTVKWNGRSDVSALAGQPVRLRVEMRASKLYAFQFTD